jgi:ADP-ribose pyrophosphatase YjhB (NUDIX family)
MSGSFIDKVALVHLQDKKLLVSLSKGKTVWYIPGGKREGAETDQQTLIREVKEKLSVNIIPDTIEYYGTFEAQAHGKPEGTIVRTVYYTADFKGTLKASAEIEKIAFFAFKQKDLTSVLSQILFDDLYSKSLIA